MSFEDDVLLGFAEVATLNENAEVPLWAELDLDGNPRAGEPPEDSVRIIFDVAPEGIDSVTLTDYVVSDDPSLSDSVIGVQVRMSCADRDRLRGIRSDIFALFHGRWGGMLGRVELVTSSRSSGTNGGQDGSERIVRTDNYYLTVHRPSTHRQ